MTRRKMATQLERSREFRKCKIPNSDGNGTNDAEVSCYKHHKHELEIRLHLNMKWLATTDQIPSAKNS